MREIFKACLKLVPHKQFTFAKVWTLFAEFEIRQLDLDAARKIMGTAIGMSPKEKLFKNYIELELRLREFDRCRTLYQKWLEYDPSNASAWIKYTELEGLLSDDERARAIYELAVNQPSMDMPELIWKSWIDYEYGEEEFDRTRDLYERLLRRTSHVKVWVSFAQFEANAGAAIADRLAGGGDDDEDEDEEKVEKEPVEVDQAAVDEAKADGLDRARKVFQRGYDDLKNKSLKEEVRPAVQSTCFQSRADPSLISQRVVLLEAWKALEVAEGDDESLAKVEAMLPRVVKKMRKVDGEASMMEECKSRQSFARPCAQALTRSRIDYDMIFADDEMVNNPASLKFLELAHAWKMKAAMAETEDADDSDDESDEEEEEAAEGA